MKKKWKSCAALALVLALSGSLVGCGSTPAQTQSGAVESVEQQAFDLEAFKEQVGDSYADMSKSIPFLSYLATWEESYLKASNNFGVSSDSEEIIEAAFKSVKEKDESGELTVENTKADHKKISQQFKEITLVEVEGKEAEKILECYEATYHAYDDLFNAVMSPSSNYSTFSSDLYSAATSLSDAMEDLNLYLGTDFEIDGGSGSAE